MKSEESHTWKQSSLVWWVGWLLLVVCLFVLTRNQWKAKSNCLCYRLSLQIPWTRLQNWINTMWNLSPMQYGSELTSFVEKKKNNNHLKNGCKGFVKRYVKMQWCRHSSCLHHEVYRIHFRICFLSKGFRPGTVLPRCMVSHHMYFYVFYRIRIRILLQESSKWF